VGADSNNHRASDLVGWLVRDGKAAVIAALAAIVPVDTQRQAVTGVLATAARGITRALANPVR
jgi:hypothetical protein